MSTLYELEGVSGSFSSAVLAERVVSGITDGLSLVRHAGESSSPWKALGDMSELRAIVSAALSAADDDADADADDDDDDGDSNSKEDAQIIQESATTAALLPSVPSFFFYADAGGARQGPVSLDAAASLWDAGYVTGATLVWMPGAAQWAALETVGLVARAARGDGGTRKRSRSPSDAAAPLGATVFPVAGGRSSGVGGVIKKKNKRSKPQKSAWVRVVGLPVTDVGDGVSVIADTITALRSELAVHFRRAGILKADGVTGLDLILFDTYESALICYLSPASVDLAVTLLDGSPLRVGSGSGGYPLTITPHRGPAKLAIPPVGGGGGKDKDVTAAAAARARVRLVEQRLALSWTEAGDDDESSAVGGGVRIVILRNIFDPAEAAQGGPTFLAELEADVVPELEDACGAVSKATVFARHPEGVIAIKFASAAGAAACIGVMNGRFYAQRKISASLFDGVTDFSAPPKFVAAAEADEVARIDDFGKWLEGAEGEISDE